MDILIREERGRINAGIGRSILIGRVEDIGAWILIRKKERKIKE